MTRRIAIGSATAGDGLPPYVIAEVGVNHGGSLDLAKHLIDLAKDGGADAVKFQAYKADLIASRHSPSYWDTTKEPTTSQHELFSRYDKFGAADYSSLASHCRSVDIEFMSTPFDLAAVDMLAPLMPAIKIASADITNVPLLRRAATQGKPMLLSTGASTVDEIRAAVRTVTDAGCEQLCLLHCILNYPTLPQDAHLDMIDDLKQLFPSVVIGYSDHVAPDPAMTVLTTAWLKGAAILEKHFTHDKSIQGNDHYHAMDRDDLRRFRSQIELIASLSGRAEKAPLPGEDAARKNARRSLVINGTIPAGTVLTPDHLVPKRPGSGISPIYWDAVIGRRLSRALPNDHVLQWDDLEGGEAGA